jgi:hypothetical protein
LDQTLEKLLFLLLGWLLGLLAPAILGLIKQVREDDRCRAAIRRELITLGHRLIVVVHNLDLRQGVISEERLLWTDKYMTVFTRDRNDLIVINSVRMLLEEQEPKRGQMMAQFAKTTSSPRLQKYSVASLDARVSSIYTFKTVEQVKLLEIKTQLSFLDDQVDRTRELINMTYTVTGENYDLVVSDINSGTEGYRNRAVQITQMIADFADIR